MSYNVQRALAALSLVGLVGALNTSNASAFHANHGGGVHTGIRAGGGAGRVTFGHGGGYGGHPVHLTPIKTRYVSPPRTFVHHPPPVVHVQQTTYYRPVYSRPVIYRAPIDNGPVYAPVAQPVYSAPVVAAKAPVAAPACGADGTFVSVVFQATATSADITGFLKNYNVKMGDGPTTDGAYRIRLSDGPLSAEDTRQVIESMKTQTAIVTSVAG